uniref:Uncharacterized protein n=1 Tax=Romanomermis culicivorax TaxID=13658 RepID=A0A915J1S5_ROMCU
MLSTSDTLLRDGAVPQCNLAVASTSSGQTVDEATVGELLQLKLSVSPRVNNVLFTEYAKGHLIFCRNLKDKCDTYLKKT